jgi:hypothetical protein
MNAFRKISLIVLVAFVAVFALSAFDSVAEASNGHSGSNYKSCYSPSHCNYSPSYCNYSNCYTPSYCNYGSCYDYSSCYGSSCYNTCYYPTNYQCIKPISFPVTVYDCYGRPSVVWQTSYSYQP